MQQLTLLDRRRFGILMGAKLTLLAGSGPALSGTTQHHVKIRRFKFDPPNVTLNRGDEIVWTNLDPAPHTATDKNGAWDSGQLDKGESHTQTFDTPGTRTYFCRFHPHMTAEITVLA